MVFKKKSCKAAETGKINLQFISGQWRTKETKGISIVTEPKIKTQEKRWRSRCGEGSGRLPGRLARADRPRRRSLRGCDERAKMLTCGCYPARSRTPSASPQARAEFGKTPRWCFLRTLELNNTEHKICKYTDSVSQDSKLIINRVSAGFTSSINSSSWYLTL